MRNVYKILVGKPDGIRLLEGLGVLGDNIRMCPQEIDVILRTGLNWFRIGSSGGPLLTP
jgi:hypothetical protein